MKVGAIRAAVVTAVVLVVSSARAAAPAAPSRGPATPPELVATYDALADAILGANKAERKLVIAILGATYGHAQSELARARQALKANDAGAARAAIENLATAVGQIGTEGDNAVAGVRKRLLQGGHHANATGEAQGVFDEGYVVEGAGDLTMERLAMLARSPKAEALEQEWKKVEAAWTKYIASAK